MKKIVILLIILSSLFGQNRQFHLAQYKVDESLNYIMLDMMKDVIDSGTGGKIRWKYKFNAPMAGKTGTTNNKTDAWFVGFTPQITLGVWIGVDNPSISLGEKQFGSTAALPIFAESIKEIYNLGSYNSGGELVYLDDKLNWSKPTDVIEVKTAAIAASKAFPLFFKISNAELVASLDPVEIVPNCMLFIM